MYVSSSNSIYFIILLLSLLVLDTGVHGKDPMIQECSNTANYTSNSQFETNLNLLLSSLLSNGTRDGFFNTSIGTAPDTVYGLVSCRGDLLTHPRCRNCLYNSTVDVFRICPKRKQALLQYDDCILRYSNNNEAFSQVDTTRRAFYKVGNVSDADNFNQQLSTLLNNLTRNAASIPNRYDFGRINYKPFKPIEGLVQCIRDLSDTDCYICLQNLMSFIPSCCRNNNGGLFYTTSCFLKFEIYPFLQIQPQSFSPPFAASPPQSKVLPSPGPTTSPTQSNKGTGKGNSTKVVTIVVPLIGSVLLLAISAYLTHWLLRRIKRKKNSEINVVREDPDDIGNEQSFHFNINAIKMATK